MLAFASEFLVYNVGLCDHSIEAVKLISEGILKAELTSKLYWDDIKL